MTNDEAYEILQGIIDIYTEENSYPILYDRQQIKALKVALRSLNEWKGLINSMENVDPLNTSEAAMKAYCMTTIKEAMECIEKGDSE